jgi:hypothetical protein
MRYVENCPLYEANRMYFYRAHDGLAAHVGGQEVPVPYGKAFLQHHDSLRVFQMMAHLLSRGIKLALNSICFNPLEVLARADCHRRQSHQHYQRQKPQWQERLLE